MRKAILTLGAGLAAALSVGLAAPAMASTAPHLTGSVALSGPAQYATFNNIGGPASGSFSYTNFTQPDPDSHSGVWSLNNAEIDFGLGGGSYPHHLTVDSINVTGLNSYTFTGHGTFDPDPSYTWNATGSVTGSQLSMHIVYTGAQAGYYLDFSGTVNADGSVTGTSFSDSLGRTLTVAMPAGSLFEVLSYTAPVSNVALNSTAGTGSFSFMIPSGSSLAGTPVNVKVHDGGSPGAVHDSYAHNDTSYTITGGNLTVH
jgi:hypothetical protein